MNKMNNLIQTLTIVENVKEFIPIYKTDKGEKVVSGRELHEGLEVKQDFTDWIKRQLDVVDGIESIDYFCFPFKREGNNATLHEYILKLEIATKDHCKKFKMVWGNDSLGRRQQFKEGIHYYKLQGEVLKEFCNHQNDEIIPTLNEAQLGTNLYNRK